MHLWNKTKHNKLGQKVDKNTGGGGGEDAQIGRGKVKWRRKDRFLRSSDSGNLSVDYTG